MEIIVIAVLIVANGVLSMAEIAVVSSRKVRLEQMAQDGNAGAKRALELLQSPNRFLSTVQIGITLVSVLQGAFAGASLSHPFAALLARIPVLQPVSETLAFLIVVVIITYLSLVIGELVPKRVGLQNPEQIASWLAPIMVRLALMTAPVVQLLSISTDTLLRFMRVRPSSSPPVTDAEINALIREGIQAGVFEASEQAMVAGVMGLDDQRVDALMTPRLEIAWVDLDDPLEDNLQVILNSPHSRFPAAHESLDRIAGIIRAKDVLDLVVQDKVIDLNSCLREALFIPETATASRALELFKISTGHIALVISEHGGVEGLLTLNNLIEQVFGTFETPQATQREDGSWLMDGLLPASELKIIFELKELPDESERHYQTLGGLMMTYLGRIPSVTDHFEWNNLRFEVIDMDGNRVDKVLVQRIKTD
ncbi:MAG: hemolysin family protein [Anaerolineae bacterium]